MHIIIKVLVFSLGSRVMVFIILVVVVVVILTTLIN